MAIPRCRPHLGLVLIALLVAGCQGFGGGCSGGCQGGIEAEGLRLGTDVGFPREEALPTAAGLSITEDGLNVIEDQGLEILASFLETSPDAFDLSDFVNSFLEENPIEVFSWSIRDLEVVATFPDGADTLTLTVLDDPTRLRLEISRLWVSIRGTVFDDQGAVTAACRLGPDADPGGDALQSLVFEDLVLDVILETTTDGRLALSTDVVNLGLEDTGIHVVNDEADPDYYCHLPECQDGCTECVLFCEGGELLLDLGEFFSVLLGDLFGELAEVAVNRILEGVEAVEGEIHPALLLGNVMPSMHDAEWLQFRLSPGRDGFAALPIAGVDPEVANDLFLSFAGGTFASLHPCVVKTEGEPAWPAPEPYRIEPGETRPHLTLSLADTFVDQALWSAYKAGMLCLSIDSQGISGLTDTFQLNAGLLALLLPGLDTLAAPDAPLMVTLRPSLAHTDFPLVRLGHPEDGESLLSFNLGAVDLGLYAWIQGRFLRLFEVRTRVAVGLTPMVLPDNELQLTIDTLDASLDAELYNELFQGVELTELVNFVLELATGVIADGGVDVTFSLDDLLSNLFGLPLRLVVDRLTAAGPDNRWLELAVRLEDSDAPAVRRAVSTEIEVTEVGPGWAELSVSAPGFRADQLEYQVRWGFGAWSGFRPATDGHVESTFLRVPGERTLQVRARAIGDYRSLDLTPAEARLEVPGGSEGSTVRGSDGSTQGPGAADPAAVDGLACSQAPAGGGGASVGWWALALAVGVGWRRHRAKRGVSPRPGRGWVRGALLLALASLLAACGDDPPAETALSCIDSRDCPGGQFCGCGGVCFTPSPCETSDDCCANEVCTDGLCLNVGACATDDDCAGSLTCNGCACVPRGCAGGTGCWEGELCEGDVCLAADVPPCDGECGPGEVCSPLDQMCLPRPESCDEVRCGPGEALIIAGVDEYLGPSCQLEPRCACASAREVPPGAVGTELSVVALGGGQFVALAHDHFYGDLVAVRLDGGAAVGLPEYIDGLPAAGSGANPEGRRGGMYAAGPDRGAMPSAALDPSSRGVAAAYRDLDAGTLRFARDLGGGQWEVSTVDAEPGSGWFPDLAPLGDGRWVVAHLGRTGETSTLRLATSLSAAPLGPEGWHSVVVDAGGGAIVEGESIPSAVAVYPALVLEGATATVVYYDSADGELRAARGDVAGPFTVSVLDVGSPRSGFEGVSGGGLYVALARSPGGVLAAAFVDRISGELRYGELTAGPNPGELAFAGPLEVVDPGRRESPPTLVGADLQLTFDAIGRAMAVYQDASEGDLVLALRGEVDWSRTPVLRTGVAGFSPHLFTGESPFWVVHGVLTDGGRGALVESIDARALPEL